MALNTYEAEQVIHFGGPSTFFGFYLSWSGEPEFRADFDSAEARDEFVQDIARAMDDSERDCYWSAFECAAIAYTDPNAGVGSALAGRFPRSAEAVAELAVLA